MTTTGTEAPTQSDPGDGLGGADAVAGLAPGGGRAVRLPHGADIRRHFERFGLVWILAVTIAVFSVLEPSTFATQGNFTSILQQQSVLACLSLGLLFPIAVGEFDVSLGYIVGFTAVEADALVEKSHLSGGLSVVLTLLTGVAIGTISGILVTRFSVHSLIATLGVGFAVNSLTIGVSGSQTLFSGVPPFLERIANSTPFFEIAGAVWVIFGIALILNFVLQHTPYGRKIYAVGGSERVARLAGIRTKAVKTSAFAIAGGLAALAGLLQLAETGGANPAYGIPLLLPAFAAVFLGATAIRPGYFNVWGTLIAILLLAVGFSGLNLRGVPFWVEPMFDGLMLLCAVLLAREEARSIGRSTA
jgi:ribose transport system permease protein